MTHSLSRCRRRHRHRRHTRVQRVVYRSPETQRESKILRGTGDAQRNLILGEAYGQDPEFFDFYRSMEAYFRKDLITD